jgi:threonine dehydratase
MTDVSPFDDPAVIAGQGTIGLELLEDRPDLEAILVPLSGGGLAGGIALAAKTLKPSIRVIGISMDRGAAMHESIAAGSPVSVEEVPSLAESLGGGVGLDNRWTFELCRRLLDETVLVRESEIYRGIRHLLLEEKQVAEGAAAVGAAALLAGKIAVKGPTALVISGRNIGSDALARIAAGQPVTIGDQDISG